MYVCYTFVVVPVNSVENRIMCMHEYYTVVLVPDDRNVETYRMCVCGEGGVSVCILYIRIGACS